MTDTIGNIQGREYRPTLDEVRDLGVLSVGAERLKETIGTTYLRSLIRHALDVLPQSQSQSYAIDAAHGTLYPYVLEGVTTPDVAPLAGKEKATRAANKGRALERNARSNFARTAASTLRKYLEAGGELTDLDVATVTKSALAHAAKHPGNAMCPTTSEYDAVPDASFITAHGRALRAERSLHRAIAKMRAIDSAATRGFVATLIENLRCNP